MQNGNRLAAFFRGTQDIIPENEMKAERLAGLFEQTFLTATIDEHGSVVVTMDDGLKVVVSPLRSVPMVKMFAAFGFRDDAEEIDKLRLLNTLNTKIIVTTYSMPFPDSLLVEFYLPYFDGMMPRQLVKALRLFVQCAVGGIREHDSMGLVG
jgi:hypothetical protein